MLTQIFEIFIFVSFAQHTLLMRSLITISCSQNICFPQHLRPVYLIIFTQPHHHLLQAIRQPAVTSASIANIYQEPHTYFIFNFPSSCQLGGIESGALHPLHQAAQETPHVDFIAGERMIIPMIEVRDYLFPEVLAKNSICFYKLA